METSDWYSPETTYWCAFCNQEIEHKGFDPCRVDVTAHQADSDDGGAWLFWAHALCIRDSFDPDFAHDIPRDEYMADLDGPEAKA